MIHFGYIQCALTLLLCVHPMNGQWNLYGNTMSDKPMSDQGDAEWQAIGEMAEVKESMMDDEDEDDQLEDVSDPKVVSDSVCLDILMTLDTNPQNLTNTLEGLNLDQSRRRRGRCFRSRDNPTYRYTGGSRPGFCYGPLYVVYGRRRYCCRNYYEHPIVQRRGRRIRCRCLYDL